MFGMQGTRPPPRRWNRENFFLRWLLVEEEERQMQTRATSRYSLEQRKLGLCAEFQISETEFVARYRLTKAGFYYLIQELKSKTHITASRRISLELKLLCALSFYATGSYQRIVGLAKHLGQTTVSKYVEEVTNALNTPAMTNSHIKFPSTLEEREIMKQKFYTKFGFPGVLGCIDGCHFHIVKPKNDIEHLFYCRKNYHSFNVLVVCDSDTKIRYINPRYGGAAHDSFVWENSLLRTHIEDMSRNGEQGWLLGDSAFPQRPWLMTPILDAVEGSPEATYNTIHCRTRVLIENTFGILKNRWRCLCKDRTLHYAPKKCSRIITACAVLHNIAIDLRIPEPSEELPHSIPSPVSLTAVSDNASHDLVRGRAIRNVLVQRIYNTHRRHRR